MNNLTIEDNGILRAYLQGDQHAFTKIFDANYKPLAYTIQRMLAGDNLYSQDIASQAFMKMWTKREEFKFESMNQFRVFLYKIARSLVGKHASKSARHAVYQHAYYLESQELQDIDASERILSFHIRHKEGTLDAITEAFETLPEASQRIIRLTYIEKKKRYEIAQLLGMPVYLVRYEQWKSMGELVTLLKEKKLRLKLSHDSPWQQLTEEQSKHLPAFYLALIKKKQSEPKKKKQRVSLPSEEDMSLRADILRHRHVKNLSQSELAERIGISANTIKRIEQRSTIVLSPESEKIISDFLQSEKPNFCFL